MEPIYYHTPSLVQHVGIESAWGGHFHWAPDYDPFLEEYIRDFVAAKPVNKLNRLKVYQVEDRARRRSNPSAAVDWKTLGLSGVSRPSWLPAINSKENSASMLLENSFLREKHAIFLKEN